VRDPFCPWNEGRYELEAGPNGAACSRTKADLDLAVDASDLGSALLGGVSFRALARAARVIEATTGSLARADAMFGSDPLPWCPNIF
jgi:predicted acetyltransferase